MSGDFYLVTGGFTVEKEFYYLISHWLPNFLIFLVWFLFFLATLIYGLIIFIDGRCNYQTLLLSRKGINRFKAFFWWVEIVTFPMLANILGAGTCNYYTEEKSIKVVNCFDRKHWLWATSNADG